MKLQKNHYLLFVLVLGAGILLAGCGGRGNTGGSAAPAPGGNAAKPGEAAGFQEYPIGDDQEAEGMNIAAVYFQPVVMEPADKAGLKPDQADIHIEADISALDGRYGFGVGEWVPNLTVEYKLKNLDNGETNEGNFMPMNASDGPHYGANVKMMGAGKYQLSFVIDSPLKQDFLLHVDKETGVDGRFWTKPIAVSWDFNFIPRKW